MAGSDEFKKSYQSNPVVDVMFFFGNWTHFWFCFFIYTLGSEEISLTRVRETLIDGGFPQFLTLTFNRAVCLRWDSYMFSILLFVVLIAIIILIVKNRQNKKTVLILSAILILLLSGGILFVRDTVQNFAP
ncbi:hypothetical protein [Niallia oryzisoli]|uniref:hypothetical protein n=1 Tax=Niallia oryzisoli TaxID=1737571 RepID=UPI003734F498